jgi:hypothetical protein
MAKATPAKGKVPEAMAKTTPAKRRAAALVLAARGANR